MTSPALSLVLLSPARFPIGISGVGRPGIAKTGIGSSGIVFGPGAWAAAAAAPPAILGIVGDFSKAANAVLAGVM